MNKETAAQRTERLGVSLFENVWGHAPRLSHELANFLEPDTEFEAAWVRLLSAKILAQDTINARLAFSVCESPIERMFLLALEFCSLASTLAVQHRLIVLPDSEREDVGKRDRELCIEPQAKLGKYRADFLITWHSRLAPRPGGPTFTRRIVVECDGHDFHERTKEQARRDKARDRTLQASGLVVMRFTGSEIWENPFTCANEVLMSLVAAEAEAFVAFMEGQSK
jgi:very-short-patch-repair endonuclease